ncbi:hypothetical protein HGA88_03425 [Candidatus Roizmanbacteria bacterium]|nr:hypothetical protein [Candidatus Roizmanbacteria bacterium]
MDKNTSSRIRAHYLDEGDSAYIYGVLSELAKDKVQKKVFTALKEKELEHQQKFAVLLKQSEETVPLYTPSFKIKMMAFFAKNGLSDSMLKWRIFDESKEIKTYFNEARETDGLTRQIARDEAVHSKVLQNTLTGVPREIWHRHGSGGILRSVIYGFNDGLTANFGLVMGIIGSQADHRMIILSGIAGLLADTLSMASSSYLAAASQKEVYTHEIDMEKEEMELMPEMEKEELILLYQAKGMSEETAKKVANEVMQNPKKALKEMTTMELGISEEVTSPIHEGLITGVSTFSGALIPLVPLFFGSSFPYVLASFTLSMGAHFGVGALRSLFTGRGIIRSGMDMFIVGLGVAIAGYLIGFVLTGHI